MAQVSDGPLRERLPGLLRSTFTENLTYKGVAIFVSIVLWFIVERQLPGPVEVPVRLVIQKDSNLTITSPLPELRARLKPRSQRLELGADAVQVRLAFPPDVADSVAIVLRRRDVSIPRGARLIDIVPDSFVVHFDSLMQRVVPVRPVLRLLPGDGVAIAGAPRIEPEVVSIVGRRLSVVNIETVSTVSREIVVRDTGAFSVMLASPGPGVDVVPQEVRVRVPVVKMFPP